MYTVRMQNAVARGITSCHLALMVGRPNNKVQGKSLRDEPLKRWITGQQWAYCQHLLAKHWFRPGNKCCMMFKISNWKIEFLNLSHLPWNQQLILGICLDHGQNFTVCIWFTGCLLFNWLTTKIKCWMLGVYFYLYLWSGSSPAHSGVCTAISRASFDDKFSSGWAFPDFWLYCSRRLLCFCLKK